MSRNWQREIQVTLGTKLFTIPSFDVSFNYKFDVTEEPNELEVEIKNISRSTAAECTKQYNKMIINAGYKNDVGNVAIGCVIDVDSGWNDIENTITVSGIDTSAEYLDRGVYKTYKENTMASEVIRDICSMTGLAIGEMTLKIDAQYTRGRCVTGKLRDVLRDIVVNDCQTNLQTKGGTLLIRDIGQGQQTGFILSRDTGLIGSPEPITKTDDKMPEEQRAEYSLKMLLNYRIGPMSRIRIDSKYLKSDAIVLSGTHIGSNTGAFETQVEVKLI